MQQKQQQQQQQFLRQLLQRQQLQGLLQRYLQLPVRYQSKKKIMIMQKTRHAKS